MGGPCRTNWGEEHLEVIDRKARRKEATRKTKT
jgi:hypothetical protein